MKRADYATDGTKARMFRAVFVLLIAVAAIISCLSIVTYPLNISAAGDGVNYLRMMILRESNLIHASGGPFLVESVLQVLGVTSPVNELDTDYLFKVLLVQYAIHFAILAGCFWMCVRFFGIAAGAVLLLAWTINVPFLSNITSTLPDWLLGELVLLAMMLCAVAYVSDSSFLKAAAYLGASFVLVWAFLVKYNAAVFIAMLLALLLIEAASWRWRLTVMSGCAAIFACVVAFYIQFFHFPSTGTRDLNYDHAWIFIASRAIRWISQTE